MKLKTISSAVIILLSLIFSFQARGETAQEVLNKAANKVKAAKGVEVNYSATTNGHSISGVLKHAGAKFYVKAGGMETWYNGKALYTHNPSTKETTVVTPSAGELAEVNPLVYLKSYSTYFTPSFSKNKQTGKYVIDLKSKSRKAPAKKITVVINSKTLNPEKFTITSLDGSVTNVSLSKVNYSNSFASSVFDYPKSRFPNVNIVDLR
ncbi:MAG: outer-membrane lipoprotein carrier protein LolA [Muribaculaceae bacterium]|nr:outer-membrane lipoprotein carrier protein LolA [Muribaculaceae bacterium]